MAKFLITFKIRVTGFFNNKSNTASEVVTAKSEADAASKFLEEAQSELRGTGAGLEIVKIQKLRS